MAESTQSTGSAAAQGADGVLPVTPFRSLNPHFGMLMGVDDFQLLQSYARGKLWLHAAWLHGAGTVWGLAVAVDHDGRLSVSAGLAGDGLGRELWLPADACLDLAAWLGEHRDDALLAEHLSEEEEGSVRFDAHVVMAHRACLERQVPALREPCEGDSGATAYSRVAETVELALVPGPYEPPEGAAAFHRLRVLFGLEEADPTEIDLIAAIETVAAVGEDQRPAERLTQLRRLAALDSAELRPPLAEPGVAPGPFPVPEAAALPLADLTGIQLEPDGDGWRFTGIDAVDQGIRPVILPTRLIQELLCGPICTCSAVADAGGPRVLADGITLAGSELRIGLDQPVAPASVSADSVQVYAFSAGSGWAEVSASSYGFESASNEIVVGFDSPPSGETLRVIVKGTGPAPVIGTDAVPLAGRAGGPPCDEGCDFVHMIHLGS